MKKDRKDRSTLENLVLDSTNFKSTRTGKASGPGGGE